MTKKKSEKIIDITSPICTTTSELLDIEFRLYWIERTDRPTAHLTVYPIQDLPLSESLETLFKITKQ